MTVPDEARLTRLETRLMGLIRRHMQTDPCHDLDHFARVWRLSREIAREERLAVDLEVTLAAAYLHDLVNLPKDHPDRHLASRKAALAARPMLGDLGFGDQRQAAVCHAIEAHSFSAGIEPQTPEAVVVQDADRLDSLGAIGLARVMHVSGQMGRQLFDPFDFHASGRPLNDRQFAVDHFQTKLAKLPETMRTATGRRLAAARYSFMRAFLDQLEAEVASSLEATS